MTSGLAWAEGTLWVGQHRGRKIHQIDPETGAVLRTIESDRVVTGVTWIDGELWHGTWEGNESDVRRVDPRTGQTADFGLAKAIALAAGQEAEFDPANTPTITVHGTAHGVILGTAAYMSPEQARGKHIDKRTDIWAFGCVLFEMLARKRAFDGETASDVIAAIIERAPELSLLPPATPAHVRRVIVRCLEKDPKRRARDIAEVRVALDDDAPAAKTSPPPPWRAIAIGAAIVAVAALGAAGWYGAGRRDLRPTAPAEMEFVLSISGMTNPAESWGSERSFEGYTGVSPDGQRLAFIARGNDREPMIWIRRLQSAIPTPLAGTEGVAGQVFWSPDGRHLGFARAVA